MTRVLCIAFWCFLSVASAAGAEWKPAEGTLMTRWAADVAPDNVWKEYPRPQMVRDAWQNLNGLWDYALTAKDAARPDSFDGKILVPFCIESALSGVQKRVSPEQRLWYRRTFEAPDLGGGKLLLHFGAVDWHATVSVNGQVVGEHRGGYDPFTFDITGALNVGENELVVSVWDPTDQGEQPRGKQVLEPRGIWYTPVTGIWQTVWLEPVAATYIRGLTITPDIDQQAVHVAVDGSDEADVELVARDGRRVVGKAAGRTGRRISIPIENPKLWNPDSPHLYDLEVRLLRDGQVVDEVVSYCGLRKIEVKKDPAGVNRLHLNDEPVFQFGPLDQGWWPDGLYTAPSDEALRYDVEVTKQLGFNMTRKHVKVEPARWYYWCDKFGLLVWQDMPSGAASPPWVRQIGTDGPELVRSADSAQQFYHELEQLVVDFHNFPSIVVWVPFNERWGQFETENVVAMLRRWDPTRLVNSASGGNFRGVGDVLDLHSYPNPTSPPVDEYQAAVCGEFGGLGLPVPGHTWQDEENWGYRSFETAEALLEAYREKIDLCRPLIAQGMAAAIYTQITDVEIEVNGLLTYDRGVIKMDAETVAAINRQLYEPPPALVTLLPDSQHQPQVWRYTTQQPAEGWMEPDFDDSGWKTGPGGFGTKETPGAVVGTRWDSKNIWLRKTFQVDQEPTGDLRLSLHHDDDVKVYFNGVLAADIEQWTRHYVMENVRPEARSALKKGRNVIAVHCYQDTGGQFIDVGIIELRAQNR